MVATTTRPRKPAAPVQVRPLDVGAGLYSALSSDLHTWYLADVKDRTCTCRAGQDGFRHCKAGACRHLIAARVIARLLCALVCEITVALPTAAVLTCTLALQILVEPLLRGQPCIATRHNGLEVPL